MKEKILLLVIAFLVSGIGGYYFKDWADRGEVSAVVASIGFSGGTIQISDELLIASHEVVWGRPIDRFLEFDEILEYEREMARYEKTLVSAKEAVDDWLKANPAEDVSGQLSIAQILETPYVGNLPSNDFTVVIGSALLGELTRRGIKKIPSELAEVKSLTPRFPLISNPNGYAINYGRSTLRLPFDEEYGPKETAIVEVVAEGFSRGHGPTIHWLHDWFSTVTANEIGRIKKARIKAQQQLARDAIINLSVSLRNSGKQPVTVSPYIRALISYGENSQELILEASGITEFGTGDSSSDELARFLNESSGRRGQSVTTENFLPRTDGKAYFDIPAGKSILVTYRSSDSIGEDGEVFLDFFALGEVEAKITGITTSDEVFSSGFYKFGRKISEKQLQQLTSVE